MDDRLVPQHGREAGCLSPRAPIASPTNPVNWLRQVLQPLTSRCDPRLRCGWQRDRDARARETLEKTGGLIFVRNSCIKVMTRSVGKYTNQRGWNMKVNIKRKIALVTATAFLLAISSTTVCAQGNSAFGRGQRFNHFKGRGNSAFGRANAMIHSAGHGNSAFGIGQFNGPMRGSGNAAFARGGQTFTRSGMGTWSG